MFEKYQTKSPRRATTTKTMVTARYIDSWARNKNTLIKLIDE